MSDSRHRQLSRIYDQPIETDDDARAAINRDPGILAAALFLEAVESDDVTSIETGRRYMEDRLAFLGGVVSGSAAAVREHFNQRVSAWAEPPDFAPRTNSNVSSG
ncbi:MAG: hypothetical protein WBO97_02405 [Tepidiformaceae bacterium]